MTEWTELTAKDVMNPQVFAVRIDATVREATAFFAEKQITGAPVVDRQGHPVGFLSVTDIAEANLPEGALSQEPGDSRLDERAWDEQVNPDELRQLHVETEDTLVEDIMNPATYTVSHSTAVPEIARTMVAGRIHKLLVTERKRIVGVVSSLDLVKLLAKEDVRSA